MPSAQGWELPWFCHPTDEPSFKLDPLTWTCSTASGDRIGTFTEIFLPLQEGVSARCVRGCPQWLPAPRTYTINSLQVLSLPWLKFSECLHRVSSTVSYSQIQTQIPHPAPRDTKKPFLCFQIQWEKSFPCSYTQTYLHPCVIPEPFPCFTLFLAGYMPDVWNLCLCTHFTQNR